MIPVAFSGNRGWLHLPLEHAPLREGIVFFSAYGVEDLATRQSLVRLASRLSAAGHPVLRFDLPGTGDSLGGWNDAAALPAWVEAGRQAVEVLRRVIGNGSMSLLGLRLGGLIASLVAQSMQADGQTVTSLALLAPILDGRQHVRELRALSDGSSPLTIAGFPINEELRQAIAEFTPRQFLIAPAQRVFLAAPGTAKYLPELEIEWRKHVSVCSIPYPDLTDHIGNPTLSRAPASVFERLEEWFGEGLPLPQGLRKDRLATTKISDASLVDTNFVEHGDILAVENGLAGIWCSPARQSIHAFVVFCNAGRNPHIGWARSSVALARRLASHGIASLRFDLAGLGDSLPMSEPPPELLYSQAGIPQLRAVMDIVWKRHGTGTHVCLVGACSGGYLAFHEALEDVRIASLVLVNVQRFIWQEGTSLQATMRSSGRSTQVYRQRTFSLETWKRLAGGKVDVAAVARILILRKRNAAAQAAIRLSKGLRHSLAQVLGHATSAANDPRTVIRQGFTALAARGTKTVIIYGEEDGGRDELALYFGDSSRRFTELPGARLVIIPDTDHDLTPIPARKQLFTEILASCQPTAAHAY